MRQVSPSIDVSLYARTEPMSRANQRSRRDIHRRGRDGDVRKRPVTIAGHLLACLAMRLPLDTDPAGAEQHERRHRPQSDADRSPPHLTSRASAEFLWQPSLFDSPPAATAVPAPRADVRRSLDALSFVDVISQWLVDPDSLFTVLRDTVRWEQRERWMYDRMVIEPRLTAEVRSLADVPHPALVEAAARLSEAYGVRYDHLWLNFYRDGRDSTAWHRDHVSCRRPECTVPVLSLGATRRFLLRRKEGGPSVPFQVASGTMLVMGGRAQDHWVHAVPKAPGTIGARISVNFQSSEQAEPGDSPPRRRIVRRIA
jgi:alkylated DNA repair dioxygenase AlkB